MKLTASAYLAFVDAILGEDGEVPASEVPDIIRGLHARAMEQLAVYEYHGWNNEAHVLVAAALHSIAAAMAHPSNSISQKDAK